MKTNGLSIIIASAALTAMAVATAGIHFLSHSNDLGLTGFDVVMAGRPDMGVLQANILAAAETFLVQHRNELGEPSDGIWQMGVDYSKSSQVREQGYRSSFYYYCWDIYLPYSLKSQAGKTATAIVHLSDSIEGRRHDPKKFHVLEVRMEDQQGRIIKKISGA